MNPRHLTRIAFLTTFKRLGGGALSKGLIVLALLLPVLQVLALTPSGTGESREDESVPSYSNLSLCEIHMCA